LNPLNLAKVLPLINGIPISPDRYPTTLLLLKLKPLKLMLLGC
jgi:hypothetical protein